MPVGTQATVKGVRPTTCARTGADILLGNTYHLMLRPGAERIAALGGLHTFMNWPAPILTDSGGFQVMSLSELRKIDERRASPSARISTARWSSCRPSAPIEIQALLGADIAMQLDECLKLPAQRGRDRARHAAVAALGGALQARVRTAPARAARCSASCRAATTRALRAAERARAWSTSALTATPSAAWRSASRKTSCCAMVEEAAPQLPADRPRYLMGVGTPEDLLEAVARGIDMFDCVLPTRNGRHGAAFTRFGPINLRECAASPTIRGRSTRQSPHAPRRATIRAPICIIWCAPTRCSARSLLSTINLAYYQELMAGHARRRSSGGGSPSSARRRARAGRAATCRRV